MSSAIDETDRRRKKQELYNEKHSITPKTIVKKIHDITDQIKSDHKKTVSVLLEIDRELYRKNPTKIIKQKTKQMQEAVKILDFETAAILRDEMKELQSDV
jgi:excinuclease ABC subunit B